MELIRGQHNLRPRHRGCVATIGNFDGVHLGHQAILAQLAEQAARLRQPRLVITFEPQPQEFFRRSLEKFRLTPFRTKAEILSTLGVDILYAVPFNAKLAAMAAEAVTLFSRPAEIKIRLLISAIKKNCLPRMASLVKTRTSTVKMESTLWLKSRSVR